MILNLQGLRSPGSRVICPHIDTFVMIVRILSYEDNIFNELETENVKNDEKWRFLYGIYDSTGHGVHTILIYNFVSHNFQFTIHF